MSHDCITPCTKSTGVNSSMCVYYRTNLTALIIPYKYDTIVPNYDQTQIFARGESVVVKLYHGTKLIAQRDIPCHETNLIARRTSPSTLEQIILSLSHTITLGYLSQCLYHRTNLIVQREMPCHEAKLIARRATRHIPEKILFGLFENGMWG